MKNFLAKLWIAEVAVFLLYCPYLASFTDDDNRFSAMWGRTDFFLVLVGTLLLAAACAGIKLLVVQSRSRIVNRIFNHAFVAILILAAAANLAHVFPGYRRYQVAHLVCWNLAGAVLLVSFFWKRSRLVWLAVQACKILSPVIPIVLLTAMTYPSYAPQEEALPPPRTPARQESTKPSVFIFVFDEWSYDRSFDKEELIPFFVNLKSHAGTASVFHQAHSPTADTLISLPQMLFGTDLPMQRVRGQPGFDQAGAFVPAAKMTHLFERTETRGYRTFMVGFLMNYRQLLGPDVDFCASFRHDCSATGLVGRTLNHLWRGADHWIFPYSNAVQGWSYRRRYSSHWARLNEQMLALTCAIIRTEPRETYAVFHLPLPHAPFIFNANGYKGSFTGDRMSSNWEGYRGNLAYLDTTIGRILDVLEETGQLDKAIIIMTSDHSWKADLQQSASAGDRLTHVPLIMRTPGQSTREDIAKPFATRNLGRLIFERFGDRAQAGKKKDSPPDAATAHQKQR